MKQLHNKSAQYSRLHRQDPMILACITDSGVVDKRCLYKWVS